MRAWRLHCRYEVGHSFSRRSRPRAVPGEAEPPRHAAAVSRDVWRRAFAPEYLPSRGRIGAGRVCGEKTRGRCAPSFARGFGGQAARPRTVPVQPRVARPVGTCLCGRTLLANPPSLKLRRTRSARSVAPSAFGDTAPARRRPRAADPCCSGVLNEDEVTTDTNSNRRVSRVQVCTADDSPACGRAARPTAPARSPNGIPSGGRQWVAGGVSPAGRQAPVARVLKRGSPDGAKARMAVFTSCDDSLSPRRGSAPRGRVPGADAPGYPLDGPAGLRVSRVQV